MPSGPRVSGLNDPHRPYAIRMPDASQSMTDDRMWLRFDDRPFAVGATILPRALLSAEGPYLDQRRRYRQDWVYIVRVASPDRLTPAAWNDLDRWCYQVEPALPLERDPDPNYFDAYDSWACRSAKVRRILRSPTIR